MESRAKITALSFTEALVRLLTTPIPAAPVTPTMPPFTDRASCSRSAWASASTDISPCADTSAPAPIDAVVCFSSTIASPDTPAPMAPPPPDPDTAIISDVDRALTETDWLALVLSFWLT